MSWVEIKNLYLSIWQMNPGETLAWSVCFVGSVLLFSFLMPLAIYAWVGGDD